jgi:LacI family transcriptional regulator, fructose operon transcriptional repressor
MKVQGTPTIKHVAQAAGVSTATVSRVLAGKSNFSPEVRERVLAAVKELNYHPNRVARRLRSQQSSIIGLIVADIQNPFFTSVTRAVEDMASEQRLSVFLCNTDENPQKEAMYLALMRDENVAGVILAPTLQSADSFHDSVKLDVPVVVIDRRVGDADVDSVLLDNAESAYRIVKHLLADGRCRIGAIFGINSTTGRERREGYVRALRDHDLEPRPELVTYVPARVEGGYGATLKLLNLAEPPDAIFTSSGLLSLGAYRALRESRLKIPDQMGFASFDETAWTSLVEPAITVIEQPTYDMGQIAAELLLKRLEDPARPARQVTLKGKLIVRQSCANHELDASI